ncbi:MAG: PPOX class F420-dependent oxidoreductase [Anaerolineales bacterium]|nr:PPOX class F420-dependent oxidoreductase [Anaerolineales bacterium]
MSEMTTAVRAFLQEVHFAVVATLRSDGMPHQTVMWYQLLDENTVLLNTPFDSLKHRHLKADPRISICIEQGYRYVTLRGTAQLDESPEQAGQHYAQLGQRYRDTFPARASQSAGERPAILNRPRVTLWVTIDAVQASGFE